MCKAHRGEPSSSLLAPGGVALIFSGLAGVLLITSEYRYGTIRPTSILAASLLRTFSHLAAGLLAGLVFGAAGVGLALGIGSVILSARGVPSAVDSGEIALLVGGGLYVSGYSRRNTRAAEPALPLATIRARRARSSSPRRLS